MASIIEGCSCSCGISFNWHVSSHASFKNFLVMVSTPFVESSTSSYALVFSSVVEVASALSYLSYSVLRCLVGPILKDEMSSLDKFIMDHIAKWIDKVWCLLRCIIHIYGNSSDWSWLLRVHPVLYDLAIGQIKTWSQTLDTLPLNILLDPRVATLYENFSNNNYDSNQPEVSKQSITFPPSSDYWY